MTLTVQCTPIYEYGKVHDFVVRITNQPHCNTRYNPLSRLVALPAKAAVADTSMQAS